MLSKINCKNFFTFFFFSILLTIPFFEFVNQHVNVNDYNTQDYRAIILNYIIIVIFGIIFSSFVKIFFSKNFKSTFFFYVISIFFFFKWNELNLFLKKTYVLFPPYVSSAIILLVFLFFFFSLVLKDKPKLKKFCLLFLSIYFFYLLSIFFYNKFNFNIENSHVNFSKNYNFSAFKKKGVTNNSKVNIYYVILDGAISLERFEEIYNISSDGLKSKLDLRDFSYIPMNSSYFDTGLSIGSIFNLNYVSEDFTNHQRNFYPHILSKKNFKTNKPNLIRILEENDFEFKWYSNMNMNCKLINDEICLGSNKNNFDKYLNFYFIINFYSSTPLISIISKFNSDVINKLYFEKNDALKIFLSNPPKLDKNKSYFFFIHSMMPHDPYFYDESCNYINNQVINDQNIINTGYRLNYLCALKRVKEFQEYIISKDKNAVVVIQGDHGWFFKNKENLILRQDSLMKYINLLYENDQKELLKNYSTLNLIKNGICHLPKDKHLDNVNSIIFAINCSLGLDIAYKDKKTFFSYEKEIKLTK